MSATLAAGPSAATHAACAHCGALVALGQDYCCQGCRAARDLIAGLGLQRFYDRLALDPRQRRLKPESDVEFDFAPLARARGEAGHELALRVDGLHCAACLWLIESVLQRQAEILAARVSLSARTLTIAWRGPAERANALAAMVAGLGFRLVPLDRDDDGASERRELLRALAVAGFAAANVMLLSVSVWSGHAEGMGQATRDLMHWLSAAIALPAIAYAGRPFFRSAIAALRAGRTNMDVPISIGVCLAASMSLFETARSGEHAYFDSAITLLFFLLVGRVLDHGARGRARAVAAELGALSRRFVTVLGPDGRASARRADAVDPGAMVLVAAGERIGVDGTIAEGASTIDSSAITGESLPREAAIGAKVFAGMVNLAQPIRVLVSAAGASTLIAGIARLMDEAEAHRARYVVLADRVARLYAPVVHVLALATLAYWLVVADIGWAPALLIAVAVLIITCPCALALAVPVVQVVASGRLMRRGILLKSASALERLAEIDTVIFDKTGTLTLARPALLHAETHDAATLRLAASIAGASLHPLARALVEASPGPVASEVRERRGEGLVWRGPRGEARLGSARFCGVADDPRDGAMSVWFVEPDRAPVRFAFAAPLRADARATIERLRAMGLRVAILSGDRQTTVERTASALGVDGEGDQQPADKLARLRALAQAGRRVLMVGDGLNDAPALAAAHVSLSPSSASDLSQTAADIVFQGDLLAPVVETVESARMARRLIRQNLALAIGYNILAVPLAMAGHVTPLIAAIAMSSSSILVVANALRLTRGN